MTKRSTTISVIINDGRDFLMNAIIFHGSAPHATAHIVIAVDSVPFWEIVR